MLLQKSYSFMPMKSKSLGYHKVDGMWTNEYIYLVNLRYIHPKQIMLTVLYYDGGEILVNYLLMAFFVINFWSMVWHNVLILQT